MFSSAQRAALTAAAQQLQAGGVIIAPTEGVYGFSCLITCEAAIERILTIKGRNAAKGLITVCADRAQALSLCRSELLPDAALTKMAALWPGPHTFVVPCREELKGLLTGFRETIALRVPAFELLHELIAAAGAPLVSTSVNLSGRAPLKNLTEVEAQFAAQVDYIVKEPCQGLSGPSSIHDGLTGRLLRQGGQ